MNNLSKEKFESVWEFCKELQDSRFSYERCVNQNTRRGELLTMSMKKYLGHCVGQVEFRNS